MKITVCDLQPANPWKIANARGTGSHESVVVELTDATGLLALGEAAPATVYGEVASSVVRALSAVDLNQLSFSDLGGSMEYLESRSHFPVAAKCALNVALLDGAAKLEQKPLHDFLNLGFHENHHVTSFSIGIDAPEMIRKKVLAAAEFPILKLKLGAPDDHANFAAFRSAAPDKLVRLDANEGWKTKEVALEMLEWLAATDDKIQFVEQPLPRTASDVDSKWLKARSPLAIFADESCHTVKDIPRCAECFHGVNVKLIKTGGVSMAKETLAAARQAGLKTMIGCMIETSVQISAAAHLAELADYLDLDGHVLITNDPFAGVTAKEGILSFATSWEKFGLQVSRREREH